ncbi:MAG: DHH family phosphoesterase, partial [Proteobacteria bacterium]|nr:DHH family phosphoesterase [Pseudomonadota bacterium]
MDQALETICRIIKENDSFLVSAHANPDGDAMGSTIALGYILTQLGKEVVLFNQSGLPERYLWMNLPGPIVREVPDPLPQWTFILDCGNLDRVGPVLLPHVNAERTINIDHHIGNP